MIEYRWEHTDGAAHLVHDLIPWADPQVQVDDKLQWWIDKEGYGCCIVLIGGELFRQRMRGPPMKIDNPRLYADRPPVEFR